MFQDYIQEHYSEEGSSYQAEIKELMDLRQVGGVLCIYFHDFFTSWDSFLQVSKLWPGKPETIGRILNKTSFSFC